MSLDSSHPKSRRNRRVFHWTVAAAFFVLLLSGLILYTPAFSSLAEGGWTRITHRVAAVSLAVLIASYVVANHRGALAWLKDAAFWTVGASINPDAWKRRHKLLITLGVTLFAITGAIQWFLKDTVASEVFTVSVIIHDIAFFGAAIVLLLHVYHEYQWWRWKKQYCSSCMTALCAQVCPSRSIYIGNGVVERDGFCNNCRLCMDACRQNSYYLKSVREADKVDRQAE